MNSMTLAGAVIFTTDGRSWAADYVNAAECETAARRMHDDNSQQGWEALKGCVEKHYARGSFTYLNLVTGGFWDEDLQTRPDAARLVAHIIALTIINHDVDMRSADLF